MILSRMDDLRKFNEELKLLQEIEHLEKLIVSIFPPRSLCLFYHQWGKYFYSFYCRIHLVSSISDLTPLVPVEIQMLSWNLLKKLLYRSQSDMVLCVRLATGTLYPPSLRPSPALYLKSASAILERLKDLPAVPWSLLYHPPPIPTKGRREEKWWRELEFIHQTTTVYKTAHSITRPLIYMYHQFS